MKTVTLIGFGLTKCSRMEDFYKCSYNLVLKYPNGKEKIRTNVLFHGQLLGEAELGKEFLISGKTCTGFVLYAMRDNAKKAVK